MGVIGAEFGQEVSMCDNGHSSRLQSESSIRRKSSIVEGFGIGNNNLSRLTSMTFFFNIYVKWNKTITLCNLIICVFFFFLANTIKLTISKTI